MNQRCKKLWFFVLAITLISLFFGTKGAPSEFQVEKTTPNPQFFSAVGAASYSIPIEVPPGRIGFQPEIALFYSSQSKNGILGIGWNIELGAIERSTKRGVCYKDCGDNDIGSTEAFFWKNSGGATELIKVSTNTSHSEYRTRVEEHFTKFLKYSDHWEAVTREGIHYFFGQTGDSRQDNPDDASEVFKWCIDKIMEPNGNTIEISYRKDDIDGQYNGEIYPDKISYLKIGNAYLNTIQFIYKPDSRSDKILSFKPNFKVLTDRLLDSIEIFSGTNRVFKYKFEYFIDNTSNPKRLEFVTQFGSVDANSKPPITFDYYTETGFEETEIQAPEDVNVVSNAYAGFADFNGDQLSDLWYIPRNPENANNPSRKIKVMTSNGQNLNPSEVWSEYSDWEDGKSWKGFIDLNGDGKADHWYLKPDGRRIKVKISKGEAPFSIEEDWFGWGETDAWYGDRWGGDPKDSLGGMILVPMSMGVVDFMGNGRGAFWFKRTKYSENYPLSHELYRVESGRRSDDSYSFNLWKEPVQELCARCDFLIGHGDFNGDGYQDLWSIWGRTHRSCHHCFLYNLVNEDNPEDFLVYLTDKNGFRPMKKFSDVAWGGLTSQELAIRIGSADFNGDGKDDLWFREGQKGDIIKIALSNGNTFENFGIWYQGLDVETDFIGFADFNGDGKADLYNVRVNKNDENARNLRIILSNGVDGFTEVWDRQVDAPFNKPNTTGWGLEDDTYRWLADLNGDGKADFYYIPANTRSLRILLSKKSPHYYLKSIINGNGGKIEYTYKPSSGTTKKHEYMPFVLHTVDTITVSDGVNSPDVTTLDFDEGNYNTKENEFWGFGKVSITNPDNTKIIKKIHVSDEYLKGKIANEKFYSDASETKLLKEEIYNWSIEITRSVPENIYPDKKNFLSLDSRSTIIYPKDATEKEYSVDVNYQYHGSDERYENYKAGLLKKKINSGSSFLSGGDTKITTVYDYENKKAGESNNQLWRKKSEEIYGNITGLCRKTEYTYYSNGNLEHTYRRHLTDSTKDIDEYREYYLSGNLESIRDGENNTTTYFYDDNDVFVDRIDYPSTTNVLDGRVTSHIVTFPEYDYRFGKVKKKIDENNIVTTYVYDDFGRLKSTQANNSAGALVSKEENEYYDTIFPRLVYNKIYESTDHWKVNYQFFDGLNRSIETITEGAIPDQTIVTKTKYDNMGRVFRVDGPFFGYQFQYNQNIPAGSHYQETLYDELGRPKTITTPLNSIYTDPAQSFAITSYTYNGFKTTIKDPDNKYTVQLKDFLGRIYEVQPAETHITKYEYNAAGDLTAIENSMGNRTIITYDGLGRKTHLTDLDMGGWGYDYDKNNNLIEIRDNNTQKTTLSYDELNRITQKIYSPNSTPTASYTYDDSLLGKGRLYQSTNGNVTTTYDQYDELGRVKSVTKAINSSKYSSYYEYSFDGKIKTITYPDPLNSPTFRGDAVSYSYFPGTDLIQDVKGFNITIAHFSNYNPTGKIGFIEFAKNQNGSCSSSQSYGYDNLSGRLVEYSSSNGNLQNRKYKYSPAGDVREINDIKNNVTYQTYQYAYDDFHQLKSETQTGGADSTGEMYSMDYAYNGSKLHAPSKVSLTRAGNTYDYNFQYDGNGNMTSSWDFSNPTSPAARGTTATPIVWNADNKPIRIPHLSGETRITYDADGDRAIKESNGQIIHYAGDHYEYNVGTLTDMQYIFAGNLRIALVKGNNSSSDIYFFHKDHLGSTTVLAKSNGQAEGTQSDYLPYGQDRNTDGQNVTSYKFTDQEQDASAGLYNYNARLYDPGLGIFISPDSLIPDPKDPLSLNRYSYCLNNPLVYRDPTGHSAAPLIWLLGAAGATFMQWFTAPDISNNPETKNEPLQSTSSLEIGSAYLAGAGGVLSFATLGPRAAAKELVKDTIEDKIDDMLGVPGLSSLGKASKSVDDILGKLNVDDIAAINKRFSDGVTMHGKDISTVLHNASYREGAVNQAASVIRDIAGGHLFNNGNKRTAQALVESLNLKGVSSSQIRNVIDQVGKGTLKDVDDIARALGGN